MDKMLIATFDSEAQANEGLQALKSLHREGDVTLYATAIITKEFTGEVVVKQETDKGPIGTSIGMLTGALIGLAGGAAGAAIGVAASTGVGASVGALTGMAYDITEYEINADFLNEVSKILLPGKTAVLAEVGEDSVGPVNTKMRQLDGIVFRIPRDEVVENQLIDEAIALNEELDELEERAKSAQTETKEALKKTKVSIETRLQSIVDQASNKIEEVNTAAEAKVSKLQSQMKTAKDTQKATIEKRITRIRAEQKVRSQKLREARALAKEALAPKVKKERKTLTTA